MPPNPSKEDAKFILEQLICELGEGGINTLGKYEHLAQGQVIAVTPSAMVNYPLNKSDGTILRVKENSGIECIVESEPQLNLTLYRNYNVSTLRRWQITLSQYDLTGSLTDSIEHLYSVPQLVTVEPPIIRQGYELADGKGFLPPRALITIASYGVVRGNFRAPLYS